MTHRHAHGARGGQETSRGRWPRRLLAAGFAATAALLLSVPHTPAQEKSLELLFFNDPEGKQGETRRPGLRPNVARDLFLFVANGGNTDAKVFVELRAGKQVVASREVKADRAARSPVIFGKHEAKDGKPPALAPAPGPLTVHLLDADKKPIGKPVSIGVAPPSEYVTVKEITFDPIGSEDSPKNTLRVELTASKGMVGQRARVDLVLNPERIPALKPGVGKKGSYGGFLAPGGTLVLRAEDLQFIEEPGKSKTGLVYLTVDGYERAFTYYATFTGERTTSKLDAILNPIVRLVHTPIARPGPKHPVTVEIDNSNSLKDPVAVLAMTRQNPGLKPLAGLEVENAPVRFSGDRVEQLLFTAAGVQGALVVEPKVSDRTVVFDTTDVFGERYLALELLQTETKNGQEDVVRALVLNSKEVPEKGREKVQQRVVEKLVLYDGKPEITLEVDLTAPEGGARPQLLIGDPLPLRATAKDPSGIVEAVFIQGKPPADGKLAPTVIKAEGQRTAPDADVFTALLDVPTQKRALLTVSVLMKNGVGNTGTKTIQIELVDPKAPVAKNGKKLTTITGTVREGGRPSPNVPVTLADDKGALKGTATTDKAGRYTFEKVPPGSYLITATRVSSRTRGQTQVAVPEGKEKIENVDVKLLR